MKAHDAVAMIEACGTKDELQKTMQQIIEDYGFCSFNFIDAGRAYNGVPYYLGTTGSAWESAYKDNQFVEIDPYIAKARRSNIPFDWKSIKLGPAKRGPKSRVKQLMDAATDFGYREGLIVPYHFRDDIGRAHSAVCVFYWKDKVDTFNRLVIGQMVDLQIIIVYFMQRLMQVLADQTRDKKPVFATVLDTDAPLLTDREREVLQWAAAGKTSAVTADILKMSELTVNTHLKSAIAKLIATNRTHAVAKALTIGLMTI